MQLAELTLLPLELCALIAEFVPPTESMRFEHIFHGCGYTGGHGFLCANKTCDSFQCSTSQWPSDEIMSGRGNMDLHAPGIVDEAAFYDNFAAAAVIDGVVLFELDDGMFHPIYRYKARGKIMHVSVAWGMVTFCCDNRWISCTLLGPYIEWASVHPQSVKLISSKNGTRLTIDQDSWWLHLDNASPDVSLVVNGKTLWRGSLVSQYSIWPEQFGSDSYLPELRETTFVTVGNAFVVKGRTLGPTMFAIFTCERHSFIFEFTNNALLRIDECMTAFPIESVTFTGACLRFTEFNGWTSCMVW